MKHYDYIILGAGASGLLLAYRMSKDVYFDDKSILIIDKIIDKGNDRTWCYWEDGEGEWDTLLTKTWTKIYFGSDTVSKTIDISPFNYKMIRSKNFYKTLWETIRLKSNITFVEDTIDTFNISEIGVEVISKTRSYFGSKLFNSLPNPKPFQSQKKYPILQQHFVGWFIKAKEAIFDDSTATFMDFRVKQKGNTRFMYVLPIDKNTALFEYTLFSKELLEYTEYETMISEYLKEKGIIDYEIIEKEMGSIPMTSFRFSELNTKHILNIGTAGGWTKASTGYTFKNTSKKTKALVQFLKTENDLTKFDKRLKFWFYDLLFLDVLANHNDEGAALFSSMFKRADIKTIFRFLDEESTVLEDFKIIVSVPPKRFTQAFFKRLF
ncbi:lycopene cyclase family protein [Winogradskyella sp. UBA3174]|uniref:lycopene cyclase family protein n=1 Tax=Winogradskyella sp. UBA3174 TaxID=1947785 RepID=UPI0025FD86AA|nr:lycopene cyclase family protein [Winogradskyella sp. UBA3174]|tara:strand:+ start:2804 stop:3943 length:1140 start_codon:yes stop_codon:yes gene_type:complete